MAVHNYGKYVVVRTFNFDPNDPEKYKCILNTWIQAKDDKSDEITFGYPVENSLNTLLRILKSETLDKSWPKRYGEVIFNSDNQDKVWNFLRLQNRDEGAISKTNFDCHEPEIIEKVPNEKDKNRASTPEDLCEDKGKRYPRRSIKRKIFCCTDYGVIYIQKCDTSRHDTAAVGATSEQETAAVGENSEQETAAVGATSEQETAAVGENSEQGTAAVGDNSVQDTAVIADTSRQQETKENASISNSKQNVNINNTEIHSICSDFYENFNDSYQKTMSHFDKIADNLKQIILAHGNKGTKKPAKKSIKRQRRKVDEDRNIGTLRYTKLGPGIVELVPNSGVYVSQKRLIKCQSIKETCWFAKCLLDEIFNAKALTECTLYPSVTKDPKAKPALDCHAREVLLDYVIQYSKQKGFRRASRQRVIKCLSRRLYYLRTHYYYDSSEDELSS